MPMSLNSGNPVVNNMVMASQAQQQTNLQMYSQSGVVSNMHNMGVTHQVDALQRQQPQRQQQISYLQGKAGNVQQFAVCTMQQPLPSNQGNMVSVGIYFINW